MGARGPLGHALGNDLLGQGILRIERSKLNQQAFAQVARANAQRIELLHHGQRFLDILQRVIAVLGDLLERNGQIAVFIEIADDDFGDFAHGFIANRHAQLPSQVFGQALRRGDEFFERRLLDDFVLAAAFAAAAVQILVEEGGDVEFVEGIGGFGLRHFFRFRLDEGLFAVILLRDRSSPRSSPRASDWRPSPG